MDVCKIAAGLYQYTAIDDCTRYKVIALYSRRTSANTLDFLNKLRERMPFCIQRIQTDRGREFFSYAVQDRIKEWKIKFRPIRPASPHLNGKVERSQRTDLDEFYSSINIKDADLSAKLQQWEEYYNRHRSHSSLKGKTPWETFQALQTLAPSQAEIEAAYNPANEPYAVQNYKYEQKLKVLKNKYNSGKLQLNLTSKM